MPKKSARLRRILPRQDANSETKDSAQPPGIGVSHFTTSDGREVTPQVARELAEWRVRLIPNVVAARVWNELFSAEDRERLGGDLQAAWEGEGRGTMAMYMRARHVTYERAMLEIAWGLAQIHQADYQRLLGAIGGKNAGTLKPIWDADRLQLKLGDQICRTVRSRTVATNICLILDAFEDQNWVARIVDPLPGPKDGQRLRKAIEKLNFGLTGICFRADGTSAGVTWEFV